VCECGSTHTYTQAYTYAHTHSAILTLWLCRGNERDHTGECVRSDSLEGATPVCVCEHKCVYVDICVCMTYMRVCEQGDNMSGTHIRHYTAAPAPIDVQVDVSVAGKHTGR
jgi:hypothetical protein